MSETLQTAKRFLKRLSVKVKMSVVLWPFFEVILSRSEADFNYKKNTLGARRHKSCSQDVTVKDSHTPADAEVNVEVVLLGEDGDDQQAVQIQALHQQPVVVGHHAVLHHHHGNTATSHRLRNGCNMQINTTTDQSQTV